MEKLQVFSNSEFGELGVLLSDGREYFPATACAKILGYSNPQEAIRTHCKGVRKTLTPSAGGSQTVNYIPEGDLYRLIVRSRLPAAERFERWVFDEVLPAIRKQGAYISAAQLPEIIAQAVQATVVEMSKHLIPSMVEAVSSARHVVDTDAGRAAAEAGVTTTIIVGKSRNRRNASSKIERLPQSVYADVVEMLRENVKYADISEFLSRHGHQVSVMSVSRFYNKEIAR